MRTLAAGTRALRRAPMALLPVTVEGLIVAVLAGLGVFPHSSAGVISGASFPLDVFFDLKHWMGSASSWAAFAGLMLVTAAVRPLFLAATLWLADGSQGSLVRAWGRASVLGLISLAGFFPVATLLFVGAAIRYAPLVWLAGGIGFVGTVAILRRAVRLDAGAGVPRGRGVPEAPGVLGYAYMLCAVGAAMSTLGSVTPVLAAAFLACLGPINSLFLLGWRENVRSETYPGSGAIAAAATIIVLVVLLSATGYDRFLHNPPPVGTVARSGSLLLLGGVDSTSKTGALAALDPRDVGRGRRNSVTLSYAGAGEPYAAEDTHRDLSDVARVVAEQVARADQPRFFLGHSQAALVLDRMVDADLPLPERAASISAPPPMAPSLAIPPPGEDGRGRVGGDAGRALSWMFDRVGLQPFDLDGPASPTNLEEVIAVTTVLPRLAVWPLADSVWLDSDWRRPGELNVVAITDHVGATNDARAIDSVRQFFAGGRVDSDEASWRGAVVAVIRYAFEPWRPS